MNYIFVFSSSLNEDLPPQKILGRKQNQRQVFSVPQKAHPSLDRIYLSFTQWI